MLFKVQRYQKSRNISGIGIASSFVCLALFGGLSGCAGAEPPQVAATNPPAQLANVAPANPGGARHVAPALNPPQSTLNLVSTAGISPAVAEQALIDAREAMRKKQWSRLDELVPTASATPLIGIYAQYWALRQRVTNPTLPVPVAELQQFMAINEDEYLADRIKGDWIVAAARAGDYAAVNRLGPVVASNASVDCSRLLAQHLTGQRVTEQEGRYR